MPQEASEGRVIKWLREHVQKSLIEAMRAKKEKERLEREGEGPEARQAAEARRTPEHDAEAIQDRLEQEEAFGLRRGKKKKNVAFEPRETTGL